MRKEFSDEEGRICIDTRTTVNSTSEVSVNDLRQKEAD